MSNTEILLVEPVDNLGSEGDIVKVRSGYARNFLFPKNKALPLNQANKKRLDALKVARAAREAEDERERPESTHSENHTAASVRHDTERAGVGERVERVVPGTW